MSVVSEGKRRGRQSDVKLGIQGMTCAACASKVTRALESVPGVAHVDVNLMLHDARVQTNGPVSSAALVQAVANAGYTATVGQTKRHETENGPPTWLLMAAIMLTLPFLFQMLMMALGFKWAISGWSQFALAAPIQLVAGARFYAGAWKAVSRASGNMDLLVAMGSTAAFGSSVWLLTRGAEHAHDFYFEASAIIITMVLLGQWLEARARARATLAIRGLMDLQPETARRDTNGTVETVASASLKPDDVVHVSAGERIPADGDVLSGESEVDQSLLTGESLPVPVAPGAHVVAGAMNGMGALRVRVTAAASNSQLGRMIESVSTAQLAKGESGRLVDRISAIFVPIVIILAIATGAAWFVFGSGWMTALENAIAVLVIACPCALGLATPAALVAGSGAAAKAGILLRDLDAIEAAHGLSLVAMDKTGTLTQGRPRVIAIEALTRTPEALLTLAASAQTGASHPLAVGLRSAATLARLTLVTPNATRMVAGQGVIAQIGETRIAVGNERLMQSEGVLLDQKVTHRAVEWRSAGATVMFLSADGVSEGAIALRDEVRPEAHEAVAALGAAGYRVVVLSGDAAETVARIARELDIDEAYGGMSPDAKAQFLRDHKNRGARAAFVGDGVNDAPALAEAALGIAVAGATDVAGEAAAITILRSDLRLLPAALDIALKTRGKIRQNLFWAFVYNIIGLPLAAFGMLSPAFAGTAMALSSVSVVTNAGRLSGWSPGKGVPSFALFLLRWFLIVAVFIPAAWVLLYAVVPVPGTVLMLGRVVEGDGWHYTWTSLNNISPNLVRAVIASEDQSFCSHGGFAFDEIEAAMRRAEKTGGTIRGASTISQQTAKNAFLWPGRTYVRKGVEAYFTVLMEAVWPKRRIMEVYLNIAEWGPGVFGAEEASQHWFKKSAKDLTVREAAALAAILPNPRVYKAAQSGPYIAGRTATITRRAGGVRQNGMESCILKN